MNKKLTNDELKKNKEFEEKYKDFFDCVKNSEDFKNKEISYFIKDNMIFFENKKDYINLNFKYKKFNTIQMPPITTEKLNIVGLECKNLIFDKMVLKCLRFFNNQIENWEFKECCVEELIYQVNSDSLENSSSFKKKIIPSDVNIKSICLMDCKSIQIANNENITNLNLDNINLSNIYFSKLPNLKNLKIFCENFEDFNLKNLNELKTLEISGQYSKIKLENLPNLYILYCKNHKKRLKKTNIVDITNINSKKIKDISLKNFKIIKPLQMI